MAFIDSINSSGVIYQVINGMTSNTTGSDYLTVLLIVIFIILAGFILRMPFELIAILMIPLLIVLMAFDSLFTTLGVIIFIFIGVVLAKNLLFSRF